MSSSSSSSSSSSKIKVRFLVDREKKRVVFIEAGRDFLDVLFSFLTLPLGSIVRLLSKQSCLGSLDNLYESVEQLDAKHLQTEACKDMLLNPRSAAAVLCEDLKINGIHELKPRSFYICSQDDCLIQSTCYYTYSSKGLCNRCGKQMDNSWHWEKHISDEGGVFVIDTTDFIITDDLQVIQPSFRKGLSLLKQLHIKDSSVLEEKIIEFGIEEALKLLGRSLVSKNALTEIYFPDFCVQTNGDFFLPIKEDLVPDEEENEIKLELILNKKNNDVLYAEVGDDFVNQLVSFLTFPLGSVLKFISGNISSFGGCIQNLYSSAERMNVDFFVSEICRDMLLTPTLPTFYGIKNQILILEEDASRNSTEFGSCTKCVSENGCEPSAVAACVHGITEVKNIEQNPKVSNGELDNDGAFVVSSSRFMISDNLHISPLSLLSATSNIGNNLHISDLVIREVSVDRVKVISLMSTMLISKRVLTDVFSPKSKRPRRS